MKKIAYIARNFNVNGISTVILNYSTNLNKKEYLIDIYVGKNIAKENVSKISRFKNIKIIETPSKRKANPLKYFIFLKKNMKEYDVIHVHGNSRTILPELIIAKLNKNKKVIAHCHSTSSDFKIIHYILKPFFNFFYDYGIACSEKAGKWMFGNKKFKVISNGIEIEKYLYNENLRKKIRKELSIDDNIKLIGHVGNFSSAKNYPFVINVFDKICEQKKDYKLILIGKYQNNPEMEKFIRNSRNSDKIFLLGSTDKIYEYYNAMDCFIFPSKYEGLGIVAIEAQINGLDCYVSNTIPPEIKITNNIQYMGINYEDANKWSKKIIEEKHNRNEIDIKNKQIQKYSINTTIEELIKIY